VNQVSDFVREFFEDYERGSNALDLEILDSRYSDSFMFGGPQGVQIIKKEDFLKVLPARKEFFRMVGLTSSKIQRLEEIRLNDNYVMVKADWNMRFEKDLDQPIVDEISATYILYRQENLLRIVFQLDHQDLMKRVRDLGLLPAKD